MNLKSHMINHNIPQTSWNDYAVKIDDARKMYKCMEQEFCNYQTEFKSNLNKHIKTHDLNGNKHACEHCNMIFISKNGVKSHKVSQHSNMRFVCEEQECNQTFIQMKSFRKHMECKHEGYFTSKILSKAYKCTLCSNYFSYMKMKHLCVEETPPQYIKVSGFEQFSLTPDEMNKRRKAIEEQNEIKNEIIDPTMEFQVKININDDIEEQLDTPQNPQDIEDELTDIYPVNSSMIDFQIKIEIEQDAIEAHASRSQSGCKVVYPKKPIIQTTN